LDESDNLRNRPASFQEAGREAGVLSELKKRQHYEKPASRKKKKAAAKKRLIKKMRKSRVE
jgi:small subunit ribosomal protein S21